MANGKGTLDCYYCRYYPSHAKMGGAARCAYHKATLPASSENRVCVHFAPSPRYWRDNSQDTPPALRFTWFRQDLAPGVLYIFAYNSPQQILSALPLHVSTDQEK